MKNNWWMAILCMLFFVSEAFSSPYLNQWMQGSSNPVALMPPAPSVQILPTIAIQTPSTPTLTSSIQISSTLNEPTPLIAGGKFPRSVHGIDTIIEIDASKTKQKRIIINFYAKGSAITSEEKVYCQIYQKSCFKDGSSSMEPMGTIITLIVGQNQKKFTIANGEILLDEFTDPQKVINIEKIIMILQMGMKAKNGEMQLINEKKIELQPHTFRKSKTI